MTAFGRPPLEPLDETCDCPPGWRHKPDCLMVADRFYVSPAGKSWHVFDRAFNHRDLGRFDTEGKALAQARLLEETA